ncbi:MMPL family transporter [Streptomyces capparidis]
MCGRRGKWAVVAVWLILIVAAAPAAQRLTGAQENETSAWLPGSAESTRVVEVAKRFRSDATVAVLVYARDGGLTERDLRSVAEDARRVRALSTHGIDGRAATGPFPDRADAPRAAQILVPVELGDTGWTRLAEAADELRAPAADRPEGLSFHVTGPGGTGADSADAFEGIDGTLLFSALAVVVAMLLLTYRSPTLLLLPVLSTLAALVGAQAVVYLLAAHTGLVVNAQSAGILTVLVFGASTDYALLLVARYREELRRHEDRHEAMARALLRAGPAVVASAATVALGMLCLLVADMNSTAGLGPVAAVGVLVGLAAMTTLFPALLVVSGRRVFWPMVPHTGSAEPTARGVWARVGRRVARRPRTVWVATAALLAVLAGGMTALRADGLSYAEGFTDRPESVAGMEVLSRYFPAGSGEPVVVTARAPAAGEVSRALAAVPGIVPDSVGTPPGLPRERGGTVYLEATLRDAPDSAAAERTVERAREALHRLDGTEARVGGNTAMRIDAQRAAARDRALAIPLILLVVLAVLALLLRALVAPLLLVLSVVLSFAAALGVSALVFRHVFHFAGEDTSFPLFVFVFLVALGIDYSIFLMHRVREESARHGTRRGTLTGLAATGGVISSAGLVLAGTFAALATLPIVNFAELGFAVAFGVLLDTFVVRSVLVCALCLDLGHRVWWPSGLDAGRKPAAASARPPQ